MQSSLDHRNLYNLEQKEEDQLNCPEIGGEVNVLLWTKLRNRYEVTSDLPSRSVHTMG